VFTLGGCGKKHDGLVTSTIDPADVPPVPANLTLELVSGRVTVKWMIPPSARADEFRIYRAREDGDPTLLASVGSSARSYLDTQVIDGVTYTYAVTAVRGDLEGSPSTPIEATPSAYGLLLEGGVSVTGGNAILPGSRRITVDLLAPDTTTLFQLSEDPTFAGVEPQTFVRLNPRATVTLTPGDGLKTVYARFFGATGEISEVAQASIRLDTKAIILAITEDSNNQVLRVGDVLHLTLRADAPGGTAIVNFGEVTGFPLFDDGSEGDTVPGDGVFEANFLVPSGLDLVEGIVTGRLVDDVGNQAALAASATKVTIADPPTAVRFRRSFVAVLGNTVTLSWTENLSSDFELYRLYRSPPNAPAEITEDDLVVAELVGRNLREYTDTGLVPGATYKWGVAAVDQSGFASTLDSITVTVGFNPVLSQPTLNPTIGNPNTSFVYRCRYSHAQNRAPALVLLIVDGTLVYVMPQVGSGSNWTAGEDFQLTINLAAGAHTYRFEAEDVDGAQVRLPATLSFSGPNVLP
jgi:hypothetical protein